MQGDLAFKGASSAGIQVQHFLACTLLAVGGLLRSPGTFVGRILCSLECVNFLRHGDKLRFLRGRDLQQTLFDLRANAFFLGNGAEQHSLFIQARQIILAGLGAGCAGSCRPKLIQLVLEHLDVGLRLFYQPARNAAVTSFIKAGIARQILLLSRQHLLDSCRPSLCLDLVEVLNVGNKPGKLALRPFSRRAQAGYAAFQLVRRPDGLLCAVAEIDERQSYSANCEGQAHGAAKQAKQSAAHTEGPAHSHRGDTG